MKDWLEGALSEHDFVDIDEAYRDPPRAPIGSSPVVAWRPSGVFSRNGGARRGSDGDGPLVGCFVGDEPRRRVRVGDPSAPSSSRTAPLVNPIRSRLCTK
jgi:hypothetical protein